MTEAHSSRILAAVRWTAGCVRMRRCAGRRAPSDYGDYDDERRTLSADGLSSDHGDHNMQIQDYLTTKIYGGCRQAPSSSG